MNARELKKLKVGRVVLTDSGKSVFLGWLNGDDVPRGQNEQDGCRLWWGDCESIFTESEILGLTDEVFTVTCGHSPRAVRHPVTERSYIISQNDNL